jgi:hypothetical protein
MGLLGSGILGCGPAVSAQQQEQNQQQNAADQQRQTLAPLVGDYTGTLTQNGGQVVPVQMTVVPVTLVSPTTGTVTVVGTPSIAVTIWVDSLAVASFVAAEFNAATGELHLSSIVTLGSGSSEAGSVISSLEAKVKSGRITGVLTNNRNLVYNKSQLDVTKTGT